MARAGELRDCQPHYRPPARRRSFTDFKVQKMLGEGSMSSVVHCVCARSGAHAAVKMYHRDRMNGMNVKQVGGEGRVQVDVWGPGSTREAGGGGVP